MQASEVPNIIAA